jgi:hypothetical protein
MFQAKNLHEVTFGFPLVKERHYFAKWCCSLHSCPIKLVKQTSKRHGIGTGCFHCGREKEVSVHHTDYYHTIN